MFHYQHGISSVTQTLQKFCHTIHISGMHSGTWFIENISHSGKGAAHITYQLQTLCFSPGQSGRFTVHREIRQTNINHTLKRRSQCIYNGFGSRIRDFPQYFDKLGKFHGTHFINAVSFHLTGKRFFIETPSETQRTLFLLYQIHQPFYRRLLQSRCVAMDQHPVQIVGHAVYLFTQSFSIRGIRTVEQTISLLFRKIFPFFIQWKQTGFGILLPIPVAHVKCR